MRTTSLVFPSKVTMICSGMDGISFAKNGDEERDVGVVGVECIVCESGDDDRDEESMFVYV
jgi:hypothetical protein